MITIVDLSFRRDSLAYDEFVSPIEQIVKSVGKDTKTIHYLDVNDDVLRKSEKFILCGVPLRDDEFLRRIESFAWIRETKKPILGICAGFEVIAKVFKAKLVALAEPRIGMFRTNVIESDEIFGGRKRFEAYELHRFAVEPNESFRRLAISDGFVSMAKHTQRNVYGVIFHPEVRNEWVVERFVRFIG